MKIGMSINVKHAKRSVMFSQCLKVSQGNGMVSSTIPPFFPNEAVLLIANDLFMRAQAWLTCSRTSPGRSSWSSVFQH